MWAGRNECSGKKTLASGLYDANYNGLLSSVAQSLGALSLLTHSLHHRRENFQNKMTGELSFSIISNFGLQFSFP